MLLLNGIKVGTKAKELIITISESLLEAFSNLELIEKYDVYQHLMSYWEETMQDDVYILAENGWNAQIIPKKNKKGKEIGWDSDLIPKDIVIDRYFVEQKDALQVMQTGLETIDQEKQTLEEENEGEDDLFSESRGKGGKITKGEITKRIKIVKNDPEFADELKVLTEYQKLMEKEAGLKKQIKSAETELDKNLLGKYHDLTENKIKELVIDDKWLASISNSINEELEKISEKLAGRIKELTERYEIPLPELVNSVQSFSEKVDGNLKKMGFKW